VPTSEQEKEVADIVERIVTMGLGEASQDTRDLLEAAVWLGIKAGLVWCQKELAAKTTKGTRE